MGGHSGTRVASHTPLATIGEHSFAISGTQRAVLRRAKAHGGMIYIKRSELAGARKLAALKLGAVTDDDGACCTFTITAGVDVN